MKFIPNGCQNVDASDLKAVGQALSSDFLTQGPSVKEFERSLAEYIGVKHVVAVSNGTAALHLAYLATDLKSGDEVITTPNTFVATSNMLLHVGAKPVFCDIRPDSYNIDETQIEKLITKKTKAIVPVHFAGQPCEMDRIIRLARKHNLKVVEDAAHALGADYKGKKIGSLTSDMTCLSFHAIKPITTGEGGAIATNNDQLYEKLLLLRSHGIHKNNEGVNVMETMGFNYRLTDLQCSLGISQLKRLDSFIAKRRQLADQYHNKLSGIEEITLPGKNDHSSSGWHIYVIQVRDARQRSALAEFLMRHGIGVNFHYPPVYSHPYYRRNGYNKTKLANTDAYFERCLTLPMQTKLSVKDIDYIALRIKQFFA